MCRRSRVRSSLESFAEFLHDEAGGPLVEFTILMPIFFVIMFGIIEWGNIFYVKNEMLIAARAAVRSWSVGTVTTPATVISNACNSYPTKNGSHYSYTFTFKYYQGCPTGGSTSSYGIARSMRTSPAVPVSVFNYLGTLTGTLRFRRACKRSLSARDLPLPQARPHQPQGANRLRSFRTRRRRSCDG